MENIKRTTPMKIDIKPRIGYTLLQWKNKQFKMQTSWCVAQKCTDGCSQIFWLKFLNIVKFLWCRKFVSKLAQNLGNIILLCYSSTRNTVIWIKFYGKVLLIFMSLLFIFINSLLGIWNIYSKVDFEGVDCSVALLLPYLYFNWWKSIYITETCNIK